MSKVKIVIPARLGSTRLKNKMLLDICGEPLIVRTYKTALEFGYKDVIVACDSNEIKEAIEKCGGKAILTDPSLPSGTDRVHAAMKEIYASNDDIIVNFQGDHPYISSSFIRESIKLLEETDADIATPITKIESDAYMRESVVKVACTFFSEKYAKAHYFSRALIPHGGPYYQHVGVYVYRMKTLEKFVSLQQSTLEKSEKLEQLRALESGMKINVALIDELPPLSIDTQEDMETVIKFINNRDI